MKDYLKLATIVLLFIAGSAVESHANPYGHRYAPTEPSWSQTNLQYVENQRIIRQQRYTEQRRYQQQRTQQLNRIEFNQRYPNYYNRYQ